MALDRIYWLLLSAAATVASYYTGALLGMVT